MLAKTEKCVLAGKEIHLAYTVNAIFEINDLLGERELFEVLGTNDRENFSAFCEIIRILAVNGALCRQAQGYGQRDALPENGQWEASLTPREYIDAKNSALHAVLKGLGRETAEEEEVDLGLLELEKNVSRPERIS